MLHCQTNLLTKPSEKDTTCLSTEEMLAAIQEVNDSKKVDEKCTVGSADVTSLYPSIDIDFAADKVCEMFVKSKVHFS